ncbi:hypothetical protein AU476_15225 [Cupriavidus sp. UYMSc13B]|nr:hypothetical protein AU476_15225 [Cupriavidus sp. UYMSc13B]
MTLNGLSRRFGVSKASGAGPFYLTALVQHQFGPQFNYYKLTRDGELLREGQKNLWALTAEARDIQIEEFRAVFQPRGMTQQAPAVANQGEPSAEITPAATRPAADQAPVEERNDLQANREADTSIPVRRPTFVGPIKYTREQLEGMYVTQMTDQQLRQASELFTEGSRAQAVRLQIEKRAQEAQTAQAAKLQAEQAEALASVRAVKAAGQERYGERLDHVIADDDQIGQGGLMEKYRDNVRAIELVRTLDAENRNATADELRVLARYVGWGGLKGIFDPQNKTWAQQHGELKSLLTDAEWAAASRSQLDAFYTSPVVVDAMYAGLSRLGYDGGRMIDPAMGSGNFVA